MINLVVAIDNKRGMANNHGIPWQGKVPTDVKHYRDLTMNHDILMGLVTYKELKSPMPGRQNYVLNDSTTKLSEGFTEVRGLGEFINGYINHPGKDLWVIGGASVFAQTIKQADKLYLTLLGGDFNCTKFFPEFENQFKLVNQTEPQTENGINFHFEEWHKIV